MSLFKNCSPLFAAFIIVMIFVGLYASCAKADSVEVSIRNLAMIKMVDVCLNGNLFLVTVTQRGVSTIQIMQKVTGIAAAAMPVTCTAIQGRKKTNFIKNGGFR